MKSYRELEIYQQAYDLALSVHEMSLKLPKFELYEQGSQIRRSSKSITNNIVEGYGRRRYKQDFIKYLIYAQSSCDETISQYSVLGKRIHKFIKYVELNWNNSTNIK